MVRDISSLMDLLAVSAVFLLFLGWRIFGRRR
ncbi:hypothetical protein V475_20565 [Sphingobium baderi LL03]|uniref:Uncharacterized protein n=1 Tax=Sphingobium baderi LL03 TaxID=1114964 RepID=T0GWS6_9SPHN|nr:hypothetical protein L485_03245 [Sphingobium baderi LL03]KMS59046.1 hypothetical protein V475_20565 [Sphingobium baderi LL03]